MSDGSVIKAPMAVKIHDEMILLSSFQFFSFQFTRQRHDKFYYFISLNIEYLLRILSAKLMLQTNVFSKPLVIQ